MGLPPSSATSYLCDLGDLLELCVSPGQKRRDAGFASSFAQVLSSSKQAHNNRIYLIELLEILYDRMSKFLRLGSDTWLVLHKCSLLFMLMLASCYFLLQWYKGFNKPVLIGRKNIF